MTELKQQGGGTAQAIDYLRATEYYHDREGRRVDMQEWGGKGRHDLGLDVPTVARDAMDRLAEGFHPTQEGVALCGNAGRKPTRTPQP